MRFNVETFLIGLCAVVTLFAGGLAVYSPSLFEPMPGVVIVIVAVVGLAILIGLAWTQPDVSTNDP